MHTSVSAWHTERARPMSAILLLRRITDPGNTEIPRLEQKHGKPYSISRWRRRCRNVPGQGDEVIALEHSFIRTFPQSTNHCVRHWARQRGCGAVSAVRLSRADQELEEGGGWEISKPLPALSLKPQLPVTPGC